MTYSRFIALGDSFTEGMVDEVVKGQYRGWADRVADVMAQNNPGFTYANLAIRGKKIGQVLDEQIPVALGYITGPETLVSFYAGVNDALRPGYEPLKAFKDYQRAAKALAESGATLILFCVLEDVGVKFPLMRQWKERFSAFNENVRKVAGQVGAILLDPNGEPTWSHPGFVDKDRLHLSVSGHYRVAQGVLARLDLPHDPYWRAPLADYQRPPFLTRLKSNVNWFITYAIPWFIRRIRGRSSGDGRSAKYPAPINWNS